MIVQCTCGGKFSARPELAGKQVRCPQCGGPIQIPSPQPQSGIIVTCHCGQRFRAPDSLIGKQVPCPVCGNRLSIPSPGLTPLTPQPPYQSGPRPISAAGPFDQPFSADPFALPPASNWEAPRNVNSQVAVSHQASSGWTKSQKRWAIFGTIGLVLVLGCGGVFLAIGIAINKLGQMITGVELPAQSEDFVTARQQFRTRLLVQGPSPQPYSNDERVVGVREIPYQSGNLTLKAYVDEAPPDGVRRPAVLFLHGGFAFGAEDLEQPAPFRQAGFIVMVPVLRGENGLPGNFTFYYDEVDDVVAAAETLAQLPYVDDQRIFVAGHSAGGTLAMLGAMASKRFRGAASFSGTSNQGTIAMGRPEMVVYDRSDPKETLLRSAEAFATSFKCPARLYYGSEELAFRPQLQRTADRAQAAKLDVQIVKVPGDHGTMLYAAIPQSIEFFQSLMQGTAK